MRRKILLWRSVQQVYMPCAAAYRMKAITKARERSNSKSLGALESVSAPSDLQRPRLHEEGVGTHESAVDMPLLLPSSLPDHLRRSLGIESLAQKELRLRLPQCHEALASLRKRLRVCSRIFDSKRLHTAGTGTRPNTRMQTLLDKHAAYRDRDVERYRDACKALVVLYPTGDWQSTLRPLLSSDILPPIRGQATSVRVPSKRKPHHKNLESEGRRTLSWIWRSIPQCDASSDESEKQDLEEGENYNMLLHFHSVCLQMHFALAFCFRQGDVTISFQPARILWISFFDSWDRTF